MKTVLMIWFCACALLASAQSVNKDRIRFSLESVRVSDSLMQFSFAVANQSSIIYQPAFVEFVLRDRKLSNRTAQQESILTPLSFFAVPVVRGNTTIKFTARFSPFMVPNKQMIIVSMAEENGARAIQLKIKGKKILKATYGQFE